MTVSAAGNADDRPLAARLVTGPHLFAPDEASKQLQGWLNDLPPAQRQAIEDVCVLFPRARAILEGIAEASPYLFDLLRSDPERALRLFEADPDQRIAQLIDDVRARMADAADDATAMQLLRRM